MTDFLNSFFGWPEAAGPTPTAPLAEAPPVEYVASTRGIHAQLVAASELYYPTQDTPRQMGGGVYTPVPTPNFAAIANSPFWNQTTDINHYRSQSYLQAMRALDEAARSLQDQRLNISRDEPQDGVPWPEPWAPEPPMPGTTAVPIRDEWFVDPVALETEVDPPIRGTTISFDELFPMPTTSTASVEPRPKRLTKYNKRGRKYFVKA